MFTIFSFTLSYSDILIILTVALLTGMSKTGVHGAGMLSVPLIASVFGGQLSSGFILPILIIADALGIWYYHRHASWKYLRLLFPSAAAGVILGTVAGAFIDDRIFRVLMAVIIAVSVVLMILMERKHLNIPHSRAFGLSMGLAGGFTSMIGNLAGAVMAVYFLSIRLPKNQYIGTTAWFFAFMNLFKVPFHLFAWHTITLDTFFIDLLTIPLILLGAWLGLKMVKQFSDKAYRWFIIGMTLLASVMMLR